MYDFNDCCALAPLPLKLDKNARQTVVAGEPDENHLLRRMHEMEAKQMSSTAKNGGKEKKNKKHLQPKTEEKKRLSAAKNGGGEISALPRKKLSNIDPLSCFHKRRQKKDYLQPKT